MFELDRTRRYFRKNGKPYFFKLDTAWMCLMNLTIEEFREYAEYRREQGYNGMLIQNTPAFQDMPENVRYFPFHIREDGSCDLSSLNEEYLSQAREKMKILQEYHMTAFLVPVWVSFLPHSQMENVYDCRGKQFEHIEDFHRVVDAAIELYRDFHPVWLIGGDAELTDENDTNYEYYSYLARQIRSRCPEDFISAHIAGGSYLSDRYLKEGFIDFYTYQSGHMLDTLSQFYSPSKMAEHLWSSVPALPIINLEPMYESHGFGNRFGRFDAQDVRRAFWFSVLNGAKAGFAYGAHGIWMFYDGSGFNNERWSKVPLNWRAALRLQGGNDVISCADLYERYEMFDLEPKRELCLTPYEEISVAASPDCSRVVAFTTAATHLDFALDLTGYHCKWYLLEGSRKLSIPSVRKSSGAELVKEYEKCSVCQREKLAFSAAYREAPVISRVSMYQANSDAVLVCVKSE